MTKQYLDLARTILEKGNFKEDRTGTGTKSYFGYQMRFDLAEGFPLLTTKRVPFGLVKSELLWFLKGDTNIKYLLENNNHIWDEWGFERYVKSEDYSGPNMDDFGQRVLVDEEFKIIYEIEMKKFREAVLIDEDFALKHGGLGHVYGYQWRSWGKQDIANSVKLSKDGITFTQNPSIGIDQITDVIEQIKTNPDSRRMIVSAWNVAEIGDMALPPCHTMFQFYVHDGKLSCQLYQRSGDVFLGIPFNIASYALLTHLIANETGLEVGEFIHTIGDAHLYANHMEQINLQLSRETYDLPKLVLLHPEKSIFDMNSEDIIVEDYRCDKTIKAPIAV